MAAPAARPAKRTRSVGWWLAAIALAGLLMAVAKSAFDQIALRNLEAEARRFGIPIRENEAQARLAKLGFDLGGSAYRELVEYVNDKLPLATQSLPGTSTPDIPNRQTRPELFRLIKAYIQNPAPDRTVPTDQRPWKTDELVFRSLIADIKTQAESGNNELLQESGQLAHRFLELKSLQNVPGTYGRANLAVSLEPVLAQLSPGSETHRLLRSIMLDSPPPIPLAQEYALYSVLPDSNMATPTETAEQYAARLFDAHIQNGFFPDPLSRSLAYLEFNLPEYVRREHTASLTVLVRTLKTLPKNPSDRAFADEHVRQMQSYVNRREPGWAIVQERILWADNFADGRASDQATIDALKRKYPE